MVPAPPVEVAPKRTAGPAPAGPVSPESGLVAAARDAQVAVDPESFADSTE